MSHAPAYDDRLVLEMVDVLEQQGLDPAAYRLGESFDPVALAAFLRSCSGDVRVRLRVEDVSLLVTDESVRVIEE